MCSIVDIGIHKFDIFVAVVAKKHQEPVHLGTGYAPARAVTTGELCGMHQPLANPSRHRRTVDAETPSKLGWNEVSCLSGDHSHMYTEVA